MANSRTYYLLILLAIGFLSGCRPLPTNIKNTGDALLYPDYCGITVPPNIAPLNFNIQNPDDLYILVFLNHTTSREIFRIRARKGLVRIPAGSWRKALQVCQGNGLTIDIYGMKNKMWKKYSAVTMMVANEEIDPYLVYRLIEPGYESWNKMGIYQRELGNFKEKTIIRNEMTKGNCMNCHSFCRNSPENMLFHARGQAGGTVIARNNELYKVNTKSDGILSAGVYPAWHPGSR